MVPRERRRALVAPPFIVQEGWAFYWRPGWSMEWPAEWQGGGFRRKAVAEIFFAEQSGATECLLFFFRQQDV